MRANRSNGPGFFRGAATIVTAFVVVLGITAGDCSKEVDFFDVFGNAPLPGRGDVFGEVTVDGVPRSDVTVTLRRNDTVVGTTITGSDGHYLFPDLLPDNYTVSISTIQGAECPGAQAAMVVADQDTRVDFPCTTPQSTTGTITGTVTVGGSSQSDVTVTLSMGGTDIATTMTGSGGTYTFTNVATGTKTVAPTPPSGGSCSPASQDVNVTAGGTATANFSCTPPPQPGSVMGQVTVNGSGEPGVTVTLSAGGMTLVQSTGSGGTYQFPNVPAGAANVTITPPSGATCTESSRNVTVPPGGSVTADFPCTRPVSSFTVSLSNPPPGWEHPQGSTTSFECKVITTSPPQPGASFTVQASGPAVIPGQNLSGSLNANGQGEVKVAIGNTGTYTNIVTVNSGGVQQTASISVTVTGAANTCPVAASASSRRFKGDVIALFGDGSVFGLRPVVFRYLPAWGDPDVPHLGLIAEEVVDVYPEAVMLDAEGRPSGIFYDVLARRLVEEAGTRAAVGVRAAIARLADSF